MKPGYKTTEFWLAAVTSVVGLLMASDVFPTESAAGQMLGILASVLASLGYSVSRGLAKK